MKTVITLFLVIVLLSSVTSVYALTEASSQYNKIFLNPFYRPTMTSNTNYTYTVNINPPDKVSSVSSAIITVEVYLTPTVNYNLWVNGKVCNNPIYTVSTTFAGASQGKLYFDCSNVIVGGGTYNITLRADKNSGSSVAWIDLTYSNAPKGELTIHGTEYNNNQIGKPWLQLINSSGDYVNNGVCYIDIYTPDGAELVELAGMTNLNHDGIYYYDYALTDLPEGVYPVIARCYYEAIETFHYATLYSIRTGTFDPAQGTIVDTKIVDGVFIRFKEIATNPVRNISVSLNFTSANICNNITEDLLTGINIRTVTKFDSQVNDDITLSIWNHTSNSWVALPNKVLEGNAFRDVSNTFLLNNITKAGFVNRTGNDLRIKFQDTGLADTATSNLDIDYLVVSCNQLTNPSWQQVQGSSEMHITIPAGTEKFVEESLCGENSQNNFLSICSAFMNNVSISNTTWGYIYDKITFYNSYNTNIDEIESYTTSTRQDCSGVIDVVETRAGNSYSILDNVTLSQGGNENCLIGIPIIFNSTENDYYVEVYQENYMKWEVQRIRDLVNYYRLPIESFCNNVATQHGITYTLPLTASNDVSSLYATNPILLGCYRSMDDLYWFDDYYTNSIPINISGEYESYLFNIRLYYEELKDGSDAVSGITGNDVLVHVNTLCGESSQYPNQYSCAKLMPPDSYFTSQEGYLIQNLTVINDFNTTSSGTYSYSTAPNIDCSAVMEVIKDNGTRTDIYNQVLFNAGSEGSCDLNIPIRNVEGIPSYQIELYIENYILWDIYWARDNVNGWNDTVVEFCDDVVIDYNQEGQPSGGAGNIATELSGFSTDKILNYGTPDDLIYGDTGYCQWYTDIVGFPITINYTSSSTDTVSSYKMKATSSGTRMPKNWTVHGQLAGGGWELIDTQTNILWGAYEEKEFTIGTPASYDEYKITIISSEHLTRLQIDDIGFWASNSSNGTFKFIIPINSSIEEYRTNPELYFCYRAMDDLYWWYYFYDELTTSNFTQVGDLGSYRYESEYFWQRILNDYNTVQTYNRNLNQIQILDEILELRDNTAQRVWNFMNRNLTDFNFTVNINNTIIAEAVWNYNGTVSQSLLSQLATYFWNYTGTINPILLSQITVATTNAIWNYSSTISSNILTQISNSVWNSPSRNLTSFDFNVSVKIGTITDGYNNTDTGLIAYYHLDSNNGTINYTADSSGNSNNGQCINMGSDCNFTSGVWNNSMSFDGINDFINITQIRTTLQSANTFSVSVWFNNLIGVGQKGILTSSNGASDRFTLDMNGLSLRCGSYNGSWYSKSVTITSGYHHAVCIRNQSGVFLYYDNTVATGVTNPSSDTPLSAYIGAYPTPSSYWNGSIDEVMIFNRSLSSDEITNLYVNGRANYNDVLLTNQTYPNATTISNTVWSNSNRTLTDFDITVNATVDINETEIAGAVWNYNNRSLTDTNAIAAAVWNYAGTPNVNLLAQIAQAIWEYTSRYTHGVTLI